MPTYTITLSSKNQVTLPVSILQELGWQSGQKFSLFIKGKSIIIQTYQDILEDISSIVSKYNLPNLPVEQAILETRKNNQKQKYDYAD